MRIHEYAKSIGVEPAHVAKFLGKAVASGISEEEIAQYEAANHVEPKSDTGNDQILERLEKLEAESREKDSVIESQATVIKTLSAKLDSEPTKKDEAQALRSSREAARTEKNWTDQMKKEGIHPIEIKERVVNMRCLGIKSQWWNQYN